MCHDFGGYAMGFVMIYKAYQTLHNQVLFADTRICIYPFPRHSWQLSSALSFVHKQMREQMAYIANNMDPSDQVS